MRLAGKLEKEALSAKLFSVAVLRCCSHAVYILVQVYAESQIKCLNPEGEFWNEVAPQRSFAVKRTLEWSKKYFE
jgi:hypothetical protein